MSEPSNARPRLWRIRAARAAPFASGVLAALVALLLFNALVPTPAPLTPREVRDTVATAMLAATPAPARASQVYQAVLPSLVYIQTRRDDSGGVGVSSVGGGVVVSENGAILTSLHVVDGALAIELTFADGSQSAAQIVAAQPENDIAVLQALEPPAQLVPATLGNPDAVRVGDEAFAVGNPLGIAGSLSAGVISGLDRTFQPVGSGRLLSGLIQIDAAVNPGNSGGPLLNRDGQVIGIVAGLVNPTDQEVFIGLGFAVPIDVAGSAAGLPPY
jgi:S1-C subfamily serine protease